jgi:hypothetical protein
MMLSLIITIGQSAQSLLADGTTQFDNTSPRLTSTGAILDDHDHQIRRFAPDGPFFMYALEYGNYPEPPRYGCDGISAHGAGFRLDHNISVWTSPSLASGSWKFVRHAMEVAERPAGIIFRPDAIRVPSTGDYVLWMNVAVPGVIGATYAAARASTPAGPFRLAEKVVGLSPANRTGRAGDFHLFSDPADGKGYVIYSADSQVWIAELTDDYLGTTGQHFGPFPQPPGAPAGQTGSVEAPSLFARDGVYYALMGWCCCFCKQGSTSFVFVAAHPLGPYKLQVLHGGDLACEAGPLALTKGSSFGRLAQARTQTLPTPSNGCNVVSPVATSVVRAQHSAVIVIDTSAGNATHVLWVGDRWQQAPDGIKGHDPQYVYPLEFRADGSIEKMRWVDNFTIAM